MAKEKAMRLEDFLRNDDYQKKVILANKVSVGNALIRQVNIQEKQQTVNVECMGIAQLATDLLNGYMVCSGEEFSRLSPNAARHIIINLLKKNKTFRTDYMTDGTVGDILNCIDEIRLNGTTKDFKQACKDSLRLSELNKLRKTYEKYLAESKLYDNVRTISRATELLSDISVEDLEYIFPLVKGMQLGVLKHTRWSCMEKDFVKRLAAKLGIELKEIEWEQEGEQQIQYSIVKAYGIANEVQHIVDSLVDRESRRCKRPFGNTAVYFSDRVYLNYIKAAFDAAGISYVVEKGDSATALNLTNFYIDLLKSAKNNFSYEDLKKVVFNRCVPYGYKYKVSGEVKKVQIRREYIRALNNGIGWGKERYEEYCENHEGAFFTQFLKDYITIFEENNPTFEILNEMMGFAKKYTKYLNPDKNKINGRIKDKIRDLKYLDDSDLTMMKKIDCLLEFFENMEIDSEEKFFKSSKVDLEETEGSKEVERAEELMELEETEESAALENPEETNGREKAVIIKPVDDLFVMERKYHYFLGMSISSFTLPIRQSAIMPDSDKLAYINKSGERESSVTLAENRNKDRINTLKTALNTLKEGEVSFLYSCYDTVHMRDDSPSVFIGEMIDDKGYKEELAKDYTGWITYKSGGDLFISAQELKSIYKGQDEKKDEQKENKKEGKNPAVRFSATGLRTLLVCPLIYYYEYLNYLGDDEQLELKGHEWLKPNIRGNVIHKVLQRYMDQAMPPKGEISNKIRMETLDRIFEEEIKEIEKYQPYPSETIRDMEAQDYKNRLIKYLTKFHADWAKDYKKSKEWKVIGCELPFGQKKKDPGVEDGSNIYEDPVIYEDTEEKEQAYRLELNGFVDRVDGYVDKEGYLQLRIIDYKSGSRSKVEKGVEKKTELQCIIYVMAVIDYFKREEFRTELFNIFSDDLKLRGLKEFKGVKIEKAAYSFPFEAEAEQMEYDVTDTVKAVMQEEGGDITKLHVALPEEVRTKLRNFIGILQSKNGEGFSDSIKETITDGINETATTRSKGTLEKFCKDKYCHYQDICRCYVGYPLAPNGKNEEE